MEEDTSTKVFDRVGSNPQMFRNIEGFQIRSIKIFCFYEVQSLLEFTSRTNGYQSSATCKHMKM